MYIGKSFTTLAAFVLVAGATVLAAPSKAAAQTHGHGDEPMMSSDADAMDQGMMPPGPDAHPFEKQMYADMAKMMRDMHAPGYTGNWDIDFMTMMIPHHQGAIDMAELVIEHGKDPAVRRLAEQIIAAQHEEIEFMTRHIETLRHGGNGAAMPTHKDSR